MSDPQTISFYDKAALGLGELEPGDAPPALARFMTLLPAGGAVLDLGRAYTYYTAQELRQLTSASGFAEIAAETGETTAPDGGTAPFLALTLEKPQ